jgi:lipid-binding SYLF domain-containing protein
MRPMNTNLILGIGILAGLSVTARPSATTTESDEDELLHDATAVFQRAVDTPAAAIPATILMRSAAIAIIPAAVGNGARYSGKGIVSARGAGLNYWTPPAVIAFEGTITLDLETEIADFVVIAQTRRGLDYLTQDRSASGWLASIAAGELGHSAQGRTSADLLAYIQFDQYFAGVTIDKWVVHEARTSNAVLYGRPYSTDDILRGAGFFHLPGAARLWRSAIAGYFREMS